MMRYLTLIEVLELHCRIIEQSGGALGIRDFGLLASAITQPKMIFGGEELYPSLLEKSAALGLAIIINHPFIDGNKRVGHGALETFLILNGAEIGASVNEQETIILALASGEMARAAFIEWLQQKTIAR
ncbi:death-on-curing family protein [Leptolyngbya sp. Heron Island J]|uniref:type II toxin-antitoxin system death-on-curing family toxin n=1 Tax=Leptolyngbya sp. Heron Island J TaxID=1385935 RepID=UPI0003B99A0F|nr:type II toxin-antitoxin system death-on-curing family toxin [Leptolyngbya sp. Heron Island J]ESA33491.1 death-on-curing family protein [Leptolyngbya sp. Heron Island J]